MDRVYYKCQLNFYMREKLYGKVQKVIKKSSFASSTESLFYSGIAHILEGQYEKGLSVLGVLQAEKDFVLAVLIAQVYGHKKSVSIDKEAIYNIESKLKDERRQASATALYYSALFLLFAEKIEKAFDYISKSLKKDFNSVDAIVLNAWINLMSGTYDSTIQSTLDLALEKHDKHPEALLGIVRLKYLTKNYESSNVSLDNMLITGNDQIIPLVEKMRNAFAMKSWDSVLEIMERIFLQESDNIEALKVRMFLTLCKNADYIETADQLNRFFMFLEKEETYNSQIFYNTAQLFSKVCSRSNLILTQVYRFAQYASEMYPNNVEYLTEVGYQCVLQGKIKDALSFFKAASKIDSNSVAALCGLTLCSMSENNQTEQVAQQIELLTEMQGTTKFPLLYLLSAKLNERSPDTAIKFLNTAYETKISTLNSSPYSLSNIQHIDPDFLLQVFTEFKKHLPPKPSILIGYLTYTQDGNTSFIKDCFKILEVVCQLCPSLVSGHYEMAKLKFLFGYPIEARNIAIEVSDLDSSHVGNQILLSQIHIQQKDYTKASQSLESSLSYNFKVKDSAMYNFLQGIILNNDNKLREALQSLTTSLNLINSKSNSNSLKSFENEINIIDKATLYLLIIEIQTSLGLSEAGIQMQEAIQEFTYTSEENRLTIAKSDLALKKGDIDKAIEILNEIKPGQPYYFQGHTKMAYIYLNEKNDQTMFTRCFKEVVSSHPMSDAHAMMGDAYMSIFEPSQAVLSYKEALKDNTKDLTITKKLICALVKMHEYNEAIKLYENSIKMLNDDDLKYEYIDLLIKLKYLDKADTYIADELNKPENRERDIPAMKRRVQLLQKQSYLKQMKNGDTTNILTEAREIQTNLVKRLELETRGDVNEERSRLSMLLYDLSMVKAKDLVGSANLLSEALVYTPRDTKTLLGLAKIYAQMNNTERCEKTLGILLNSDPNNESAAVMMADLAFRKVDLETAARHLEQILSVKSNSWEALSQLIEVQWRRGKLVEVETQLEEAKLVLGDGDDAGHNYCQGLYAAYDGKPNIALRQLNQCRRSARWCQLAVKKMILLCLTQNSNDGASDSYLSNDDGDTRILALRTAEKLVAELAPSDRKSLQALIAVASKSKSQAEKVLQDLLPAVTEHLCQDDPYLILAIANAYNVVKQPNRAKNILKRTISSIAWTPEKADGLERCWLEVVESQVSGGRNEAAKELLSKIIHHNQACAAAYQYQGLLAEKEQNYKLAAQSFDNAWTYGGKTNLAVGYKLSQAYLKLKKYPECIVVCRHILKIYPDYPKLRKEIFEKAKTNLRT